MADDTLFTGDFENSPIVKTHMGSQERFGLACLLADKRKHTVTPRASLVRELILCGLEAYGWDEARLIKEYAAYRLRCIETGVGNLFESE
jgi:hypothetical protein